MIAQFFQKLLLEDVVGKFAKFKVPKKKKMFFYI